MKLKWKSLFFALLSFVMFDTSSAHAICLLQGTQHNDYLQAPNDGCPYAILAYGGNDTLIGNNITGCQFPGTNGGLEPGIDTMTGGAPSAADWFIWDNSNYAAETDDVITDFSETKGDAIFLAGPCLGKHCTFIGGEPFHGIVGEVRYQLPSATGQPSQVQADFTGSGTADFVINLTNGALVTSSGIAFVYPDCPPAGPARKHRPTGAAVPFKSL